MAKVTLIKKTEVKTLTLTQAYPSLMKALLDHNIAVASSCGGEGVCAKCQVEVLAGADHLSPISDIERIAIERFNWKPSFRMSCQCQVNGDCTVTTPYW